MIPILNQHHFDPGNTLRNLISHHRNVRFWATELKLFEKHTYDRLHSKIKSLLIIRFLHDLALAVGASFLSIFIWRKTDDFSLVLLYNLVHFSVAILPYTIPILLYKIRKKHYLQLSVVCYLLMFLSLLWLETITVGTILITAALHGLAAGTFWAANHSLAYENTDDSNRDIYYSLISAFGSLISLVSPIILSVLFVGSVKENSQVDIQSYSLLFLFTIGVLLINLYLSKNVPSEYFPKYKLKQLFSPVKNPIWKIIILRELIDGLRGGIEGAVGSILVFLILTNELNISILNTFLALSSILISLKMATFIKRDNRLLYGGAGSLLLFLARIIFVGFFNYYGILVVVLIELFANPLFGIGLSSTYFDAIDHSIKKREDHMKFVFLREIPLTVGRIISIILVWMVLGNNWAENLVLLKGIYMVLGIMPFVYYILTYVFESRFDPLEQKA